MTALARLDLDAVVTDAERLAALVPDAFDRSPNPILLQRVRSLTLPTQAVLLEHANGPVTYFADPQHRARIARLVELRLVYLCDHEKNPRPKASALTCLGSVVVCALLARMADALACQQRARANR